LAAAPSDRLTIRALDVGDAADVQETVVACAPLTLHTPYTYWVILAHGSGLSVGAWEESRLAAVALAIPFGADRAFVWQIGVRPELRRGGLSQRLLERVWDAAKGQGLASLEATVAADNQASMAAFSRFADSQSLGLRGDEVAVRDADGSVADREIHIRLTAGD
jgi:diaminobutyrate acetyltransferase